MPHRESKNAERQDAAAPRRAAFLLLAGATVLCVSSHQLLRAWGDLDRSLLLCAIFGASGAACLLAMRAMCGFKNTGSALAGLLVCASLGPLSGLGSEPRSSDDVWRYLWEGRLVLAGENPYRVPPSSARFDRGLSTEDTTLEGELHAIRERINHPTIATIYPATAMAAFTLAGVLGGNVFVWRLLLWLAWAAAGVFLGWQDRRAGRDLCRTALWLFHPLIVLELQDAGHIDALGASLVLVALLAWSGRSSRNPWAAALLLLSVFVKPVALAVVPRALWSRSAGGGWPPHILLLGTGALLVFGSALALHEPEEIAEAGLRLPPGAAFERVAVDGVAAFARSEEARILVVSDTAQRSTDRAQPPLLGRFHLATLGAAPSSLLLVEFDGQGRVFVGREGALTTIENRRLGYAEVRPEGDLRLGLPGQEAPLFEGRVSAIPSVFEGRGDLGRLGLGAGPAALIKAAERPLMGASQFSERWSGRAFLHPVARSLGLSRQAIRLIVAAGLVLIAAFLGRRTKAFQLGLGAFWIIAALPVIHPWYVMWLLPPLLVARGRHERVANGLAIALSAAIFLHLPA